MFNYVRKKLFQQNVQTFRRVTLGKAVYYGMKIKQTKRIERKNFDGFQH